MQGLAYFPGINQLVGASITFVHGISPSVATLTIAPQSDFTAQVGTLQFAYDNVVIDFPDCKVDANSFQRNDRNEIWRLTILDRRWKWIWGQISGSYNLRDDQGTLVGPSERTPQQLAALCLDAMGESGYDVGDLPNDTRPRIDWDFDIPAQALNRLCDELGCRVLLQLNNTVAIRRVGIGQPLPSGAILENSLTIDPPECPDRMAVVCGSDRFQVDFLLEAVGIDLDGAIRPIDQLSYKPSDGWSSVDLPYMIGVTDSTRARELAQNTVFKWYRIKLPIRLPDISEPIESLDRILPLEAGQIDTAESTSGGQIEVHIKPPQVYGIWFLDTETFTNAANNVDPTAFETNASEYRRPFVLDRRLGIVKFKQFVYRNTVDNGGSTTATRVTKAPATLRLRVACSLRDSDTFALLRYTRTRDYGNSLGTPTRYLQHEEIVRTHVPRYDANFNIQSVKRNDDEVNGQCDYYLDAAEQEYATTLPHTLTYVGLQPIDLDGAIRQLTLVVGPQGATTIAAYNNEQLQRVVSYHERQLLERWRPMVNPTRRNRIE